MSHSLEKESALPLQQKRALLAELLRQQGSKVHISPLSFAQQRLWFLAQLEPDNPSYNIAQTLRLGGELDVKALEQTLNRIIARHESLRTTFKTIDGQPVQIVSGHHEINLRFTDLEELPEAERETEARQLAIAEAWSPFDLSRDYPLRAALVRLKHDEHWLLLTMHHIASDGWSMGILRKELSKIYDAITTNQTIDLPELSLQYADFAEWQREWLQGEVFEDQLSYWQNSLAGIPPELKLPSDRPRAHQSFRGASLSLNLSKELSGQLGQFSQREGVTLFMTLLAAFQTLLFRYTGQEDIVVGTPIAGRNRVEIEDLIGFFVNTLPVRTNCSGDPKFRRLLAQVREATLGAFAHQDLPFEKLVEELNPERNSNHSPIFQVVFSMQNAQRESLALNKLTTTPVPLTRGTAKFDLTLFVNETDQGLSCSLEYSTDLFEEDTIRRMLGHFETLLEGVVADPDRPILQLPLLTEAERTQLLTKWNDTQTDFPREQCIHQIFEQQVDRMPNSIALEFDVEQITYVELNRRANQLAHYLRKLGVGPDKVVGLCVERSPEMFVGILGILKAGAAYLPLDPAYPRERLSFILKDARARVLLSEERLKATLPDHSGETIFLDRDWKDIERESVDKPENAATPEDLAYVMYTSGSTGKPKGVAIPHRAVVRLVQNTNYAHFGPDEVFLQFAPLAFDASTFEIWGSLLNGGRLVVIQPGLISLTKLGETVKRQNVTTLWLAAGLFHQMVETELESLRGVRQLIAGGDVLSVTHVEQAVRELHECQLINGYGPTENTTFTCCYPVKPREKFTSRVPIGFPISNTQVYILDEDLSPVPIGVVGELYTGGAGLASGYLNSPVLTAEKFIPHPLSEEPGARLYRTGDLARYRADGSIEFLERVDHQVKLRGYRIELGEVETAIKEHPAVRDAVVVVGESAQGDKHLVSYFLVDPNHPETGNKVLANELKGLLKKTLPDFMIPSYFVPLEHVPLMRSGKIDRSALPQPNGAPQELEEAHIAPRDDLERRLVQIWEKLLGLQSVGIRDNFFDLGGHSLLAVRLFSEIEKAFGQRLPLISLFQGSTIEYLAELLRKHVASISWPTLVEIQAGDSKCPLFCVSHPNVNALGYRSLARHLGPEQSVFGLQAQYPEDLIGEYSQAAVDRMATEYLESLRAVRPTGPYQFVGICRGAHIAFEIARRLEQEGQQVAMLGILDTWVAENTYSVFFFLDHYAHRLIWLSKIDLRNKINFIRKKARGALRKLDRKILARESAQHKRNPLHDVYFPGPDFVPRTYNGRIAVFRVRRQSRQRIRDLALGWGKIALGGVDVHFIPGDHSSVLKEPYVQGLATELKKRLLT